jgi:hypothetical protein
VVPLVRTTIPPGLLGGSNGSMLFVAMMPSIVGMSSGG